MEPGRQTHLGSRKTRLLTTFLVLLCDRDAEDAVASSCLNAATATKVKRERKKAGTKAKTGMLGSRDDRPSVRESAESVLSIYDIEDVLCCLTPRAVRTTAEYLPRFTPKRTLRFLR